MSNTSVCITLHSDSVALPIPVTLENERFGIVTVDVAKVPITKDTVFILFTIDRTGSMSEPCELGKPEKLHYLKETFKQIIQFLVKQDAEIHIAVHVFNKSVETAIHSTRVLPENADDMIQKIDQLVANGSTAIDAAVIAANKRMREHMNTNPNSRVCHIFMTDGEPTVGIKSTLDLAAIVDSSFPNAFIGFGKNHNFELLRQMSLHPLATYDFVDNVEHTGMVYGNIIHELLYPALEAVSVKIQSGLLYDWTTNTWTDELNEPFLVSESKKIYHVKCTNSEDLNVELSGSTPTTKNMVETIDNASIMPDLVDVSGIVISSSFADLTKYAFRQSTQELLFEARSKPSSVAQFKKKISNIFRQMRRYMRNCDLLCDPLMLQLCDDLSITYRTCGTRSGAMYSSARERSQGRQQSNTTPMAAHNIPYFPQIQRQYAMGPDDFANCITPLQHPLDDQDPDDSFTMSSISENALEDDDSDGFFPEDHIDFHVLADTSISCFATPSAVNTMRSMSQPIS